MIECSDLFPFAEWACAHVDGGYVRINIQNKSRNIHVVHMQIDKIANFLDQCRREQLRAKPIAPGESSVVTRPSLPSEG